MPRRPRSRRRPLQLETLEDRILCSASVPVDPALDPQHAAPAAAVAVTAAAAAPTATAPAATATVGTPLDPTQLTDAQRAALASVVKDTTGTIWFQENVGQFAEGVRYGFKTQFGAMLVYDDHISIVANQTDPTTGAVGLHTVNLSFTGANPWQIVPGGASGVLGNYEQADGTMLTPHLFNEITLRNVYNGVDLRLYSADQGVLEFDWLVAKAQDYEKIRLNFTGQDGIIFNADGSATLDLRYQDLTLKMPEVYQLIDGQKQLLGAAMVADDTPGEMRYALSGNIVRDQPLVIDPNVAWSTYFDLNDTSATGFDSYLFAINANSNGVYAFGWVKEIITNAAYGATGSVNQYMQVNAGFAEGTAAKQAYIYRFDAAGLNITAWTGTGITNADVGVTNQKLNGGVNDTPADLEFFPDGRVLAAFNSGLIRIYSADLSALNFTGSPVTMDSLNSVAVVDNNSFYASGRVAAAIPVAQIPVANLGPDSTYAGGALGLEGVIVRYGTATATPTAQWATYVGGDNDEYFTAIALTPDKTKLVFATSTLVGANYSALVNAVDSTPGAAGTTELLVGVLADSATVPAAFSVFSFLGGTANEGTLGTNTTVGLVTATDSFFYVAGNTASTDLPGTAGGAQTANAGGNFDVFVSRIALNGSAGVGFQSTYLGGTTEDNIGGIALDTRADRLLVFGTTSGAFPTLNTSPGSSYFQGAAGGGLDIFVATLTSDLTTKDYATYIGGANNDYLGQTGDLIGQGHVVYSAATGLTYLATTVHSNLPVAIIGTPPGKDTVKSNPTTGSNDVHVIFAFNINIFDYGDAPVTYEGSPATPAKEALTATLRLGASVDAESVPASGATATGDDTLGAVNDEDAIAALSVLSVGDTTYSASVSVFNNTGAAKTIHAWIDFNLDGTFEASEYTTVSVPTNAAQQTVTLLWSGLPALAVGQSYLRLRLTDAALTDNAGTANIDERSIGAGGNGEIEDYALAIVTTSIAGTVYSDLNNDALIGGAEARIASVTLTLTGTNDLGVAVSRTTTTNASGAYTFANLRPSDATGYSITETQPAGFLDGKNTVGTAGGTTVNNPLSDVINGVVVGGNVATTGYNFGELAPVSLAGTVYLDLNNDGVRLGAGETGVNAVTVTLTGTDDLGNAISTSTTTNASGAYAFANLRPGTYLLTETQPGALLDGKETVGSQASGTINNAVNSNTISAITLGAGTAGTANNFGELPPSSFAGTVFIDVNNDGVQLGAGETGINAATVTLTGSDDRGTAVNISTTTNASGAYSFGTLRPGTYIITETQPAGFLDGKNTAGTAGGTTVNNPPSDIISAITLAANVAATGYNFGELSPSSLAGVVFRDLNNDGIQLGAGETATSGVTVTLTGTDDLGNAVSTSTATNAAGAYSFASLRPGTYTLTETQPAGLLDGKEAAGTGTTTAGTVNNTAVSNTISNIVVGSGQTGIANNFAELPPSAFSGTVYRDLNNDGVQLGAGETGVAGVTITLTGTDDFGTAVNVTTTTDVSGNYAFATLRPGTYTITETAPAGLLDGKETVGSQASGTVNNAVTSETISTITLAANVTGTGNNFGELPPTSLAGTIYIDVNNDGIQSGAGETGINGATVTLTGTDDRGAAVNVTATSNASGAYSFTNLRPGTYAVTETQPAGFLDGKNTAGTAGGTTVNNPPSDVISAVTLTSNTTATGYNFGELSPGSLAGVVFNDLNNDGVQQTGDLAISGVTITLTGTDDLGNAVSTTATTNASGAYTFASLRPGTYTLTEIQPAGLFDGREAAGTGTTTAGTVNNTAVSNTISSIVLGSGQTGVANNFADLSPASIAGTIYNDVNNDGIQLGAGETGISGATVTLTGTDDFGAAVNVTATSNASGAYTFTNLRPGSYVVTETQPVGFLDGKNTAGTAGGTTVNNPPSDVISAVTLTPNTTATGYNFGELAANTLSGIVYRDVNNDGVQLGAGETGVTGVTITLTGTDDLGNAVSASTTTDASGNYTFATLRPGTYTLTETQPAGLLDGRETVGSQASGTIDNTTNSNTISTITLGSGTAGTGNNFGELPASSFAGTVFIDANNDGIQLGAGETGISGAAVTLTGTDDRGAAVSLSTTTNASGAYSFITLRPGSYTITETQPTGFLDGKNTAGTAGGTTVNNPPSDVISAITLPSNTTAMGYNFGELQGATLSGSVYLDANNDGIFQGGETAQSGVTVTLTGTDDLGNAASLSTTTNGAGAYFFTTLRPGTYTLTETQPAGLLDGKETVGTQASGTVNNAVDNNTINSIVIASGQTGAANNFGELSPASLAATVYRDVNNDGVQLGAGETGISGATVTITGTDDRGAAVSTAPVSDASGNVFFTNLRPGTYTITETQPGGFNDGLDSNGTPAGTLTNDQVSNITVVSGTTGTGYKFGELPTTSISGTVYSDVNNDGLIAGAGETGISGVAVTLTGTNDLGAAVNVTATTDASGNYTFTGLRPSSAAGYTITETQPAGFLDGKNTAGTAGGATVNNPLSDVISGVVLTSGTGATSYNFGELAANTLSGTVYRDLNNDGVQAGAGEMGVTGVTITLTGTDDLGNAVSTSTTTDASGIYSFATLRPGTYTITETAPAGLLDGKETVGAQASGTINNAVNSETISAITLGSGVAGTGNNFGELSPTSLAGTIFIDVNNDGAQSGAGETGINGATVTLTGTDDRGAAVNVTATSNVTGAYSFANLRPGSYVVTETQPAGFLDGKNTAGTAGGTTVNNPPTDVINAVTLASNTTATGYNFGELSPNTLSGTVYRDLNNDGVQSGAAETGVTGVTITLSGTDDLGNAVSTSTTTDASGNYSFATLRPGTYTLTETQPAGLLDGKETVGSQASGTIDNTTNSNTISTITLASGVTGTGNNFGELPPTSLVGTIYIDVNNDGVQSGAGEMGISGATVTLTGTDDRGAAVSVTGTSTGTGAYSFTNLRPGSYVVTETQPAGFLDGKNTAGTAGGTTVNNPPSDVVSAVTLTSNTTATGYNFGELSPGSLAGVVFNDVNNDGVQQAGDLAISSVTVTLTGTDDLGNAVSVTATTNGTGAYSFATLRPGTYTLTETQPAGVLDGKETAGTGTTTAGTVDNTAVSNTISGIVLGSGETGVANNFAELSPASLAGTIYNDLNNDGIQLGAGETGISGTTVTLAGTDDFGAVVNVTATSNASGAYSFTNLRPGSYTVTETQPAGFLDGKNTAGTAGGTTVNTPPSDVISAVTLLPNTTATGYNFGELAPSTLSGAAYIDANNDGVFQVGETAQSGVTVTLSGTDDLGNAVSLSTTTNGTGAYTFGSLRPGTYTLTETQPAGLLDGRETAGTQGSGTVDNTANSNTIASITLAANTTGAANNFADLRPATLAGAVFSDGNNDGLINGGDSGISGATVTLTGTDDRGNAVSTTATTGAGGAYSFAALRPGTYTISETQPAGFLDGKDVIGTPGGTAGNDVFSNVVVTEGTNGTANNFAELAPASLSGSVYIDANNDGVRQGGESGLAGVTVTLSGTDDLGSAVSVTTTTDGTGAYSFGTQRPSNVTGYTITETQPAAYGDGTDAIGTQGGTAGNDVLSAIILGAGINGTGNTFGERIVADLSITKTDGSGSYIPGTAITYTVVVGNSGPSFVTGATVADTIPANITGASWTAVYAGVGSSGAASGSGDINTAVNLASGGSATFTITGTVLSTATGNLVNTATVAAPAGVTDPTPGNNSATDTDAPNITADLSITKTDGVTSVVPGTAVTYTVVVSNTGPSFVTGASVSDTLPATLTGVSWTAVYAGVGSGGAASGSGNITTLVNLASGGTATFLVTGTVAATATGTLANTATVTPPVGTTDPTPGNNSATDTDTLTPTADLSITKTDGSASYVPGTAITYTVVVGNSGPSFVTGAVVADTIPANITGASWTAVYAGAGSSGGASGSGDINTAVNLASGGSATFTITGTVLSTATGNLVNTATVAAPAGVTDPTPGNNSATDTDTASITADLAITKTDGVAAVVPGTATTYTVVVSNTGPSFVTGATVADTLPAALTGVSWTASYTGAGSSGAASGSGNISTLINLAAGGTATFTVTGTVASTATGTLANTATVTPPVGVTDPTPGNNSATDTDTLTPTADLVITKTDGSASYISGQPITYTVVVSNTGPSFVTGATITDAIPANISGAAWTAVYGGAGSSGAVSGSGDINTAINLASGGSATFTVTGTVLLGATGNLTNTASVAAPAGVTDPTPGNNSATDTDTRDLTSLAGFVFNDANNDGTKQGGENGIAGATVTLTGTDNLGGAVNLTATTLADGSYSFVNLRPSNAAGYTITETQPAGFLDGTDTIGTPGGTTGGDVFSAIILTQGTVGTGNNFGELAASSLSGFVYNDTNNNGTVQAGENGVGGVTVTLTGTNDIGASAPVTVTTAADGSYTFGSLRPGTYAITETQPAAFLDGKDTIGTPGGVTGSDTFTGIVLASGTDGAANNFGELRPASLSGSVFDDRNNNATADPGENGIGGVSLVLSGTDDLGNAVSVSVLTQPDGTYSFGSLRPGTYTIMETTPAAFLDGTDTVGTQGGTAANDVFSNIVLTEGASGTGNNFAELTPATLSGNVFIDANNDGVLDAGETGQSGVTVTLTGTDDHGIAVNVSATTLADGSYSFTGLRPSNAAGYTITETQPAGLLDGQNAVGSAGGSTVNNPPSDVISGVVVTPGTTAAGYNFGELRPATLSGTVFRDDSNDGTQQAGEPGVGGVTITLTGTDDLGNAVSFTTVSSAVDGSYSFGNLRPGTYALTETQPAGLLDGKDALGTAGGTLGNDTNTAIILAEGQTGSGYTFGEIAASSFAGMVFDDLNNNGGIDAGEAGIGGATVTLTGTDDLGNAVSLTTTSALDGTYGFSTLRPGTYTLTETQPAGFLDGQNTAGTAGGTTVNNPPSDVISAITLPSNSSASGYLFGELAPASFNGTIFQDLNNNGANDPTDLPIAGAVVTLTGTDDLGNAVTVSATSAVDGSYSFANLRPGTYTLTETQPAGYRDGTDTAGSAGGTQTNDTFSAIAIVAGQTGGGYLFGELTAPDLMVTKTDGTATAKPGDLLTYTITVANASLQQADSVTVTDQFPSALQFVSASNGGTLDPVTSVITWNLGVIAGSNAQTVTLTVIARVPATLPHSVKGVTNTVIATDVSGVDANPANNTASDTDSIPAAPDLYVHKTDNLVSAKVGQQTTYTITGGNAGEQIAEGVVITDTLPPGLRFVSASNGGRLVNGRVVWNLGDLAPGATFRLTVRVVVEASVGGKNVVNSVSIADRFGSLDDVTPFNNTATDPTLITTPFVFAFDSFHDFGTNSRPPGQLPLIHTTDVSREALLPLAPVYSGEADPGATLVVTLYNAKGEQIGSQTVMVDAGGNWLITFTSSVMRDAPSSVRISMLPAPSSYGDTFGHNLRTFFSPALNPGHFFETVRGLGFDRGTAPLLEGLGLENPLQLGSVKYGGELLSTQGTASGE